MTLAKSDKGTGQLASNVCFLATVNRSLKVLITVHVS